MASEESDALWAHALAQVIDDAHLAPGEALSALVDDAVRPLGLTAELFVVDLAQRTLISLAAGRDHRLDVDTTAAGRCYRLGEITPDGDGCAGLWVPVLDGTDRVGVLRVDGHGDRPSSPDRQRDQLWTLAGLIGHIVMTKMVSSDPLRRIRTNSRLTQAAELLWQLLPPRTFATDRAAVSALLEPHTEVAGDGYDYNVERDLIELMVFDAAGHDLSAGLTAALTITAARNARRSAPCSLPAVAAAVDEVIAGRPGRLQFATAVLARLDTRSGELEYLIAGHPSPLLLRGGRVVKEIDAPRRPPLGVPPSGVLPSGSLRPAPDAEVGRERLEPGDRVLIYTDGVVEARDRDGAYFGEQRLKALFEQSAADGLSAPETLRTLTAAVLDHQRGVLQDDATLLLVEWSPAAHRRMMPT